jgi:hypothetical protein
MCFILECITGFFEILMVLCCHKVLKWDHHTLLAYPAKFASSKEPEYNMLLLQCIIPLLWTMILMIVSFLTMIPSTHPSRNLVHLYFFYHQYNLPNMHLYNTQEIDPFLLDTITQILLCL